MATRLVLDELDLDLSALTATLLIIIVVIFARHRSSVSTLANATAVVGAAEIIAGRGLVETGVGVSDVGHVELGWTRTSVKGISTIASGKMIALFGLERGTNLVWMKREGDVKASTILAEEHSSTYEAAESVIERRQRTDDYECDD